MIPTTPQEPANQLTEGVQPTEAGEPTSTTEGKRQRAPEPLPTEVRTPHTLTVKQEGFCLAYMRNGGNATEAYRDAYDAEGLANHSVTQLASRLLANVNIARRIAEHRDFAARSAGIEEARVIAEVADIALSDPYELFDEDHNLRQIRDMPRHVRACIASVEVETRTSGKGDDRETIRTHKVKLWNKNDAANMLMKHLGSYEKDNRQKAGMLDGLSRETLLLMKERLLALRQRRAAEPRALEAPAETGASS